jgi:hypothetical protein
MKKYSLSLLITACASLASLPVHAQVLANASSDYAAGTINSVMTPLSDTHGTGTWTYDLAYVNTTSSPTAVGSPELLTYENNTVGGSTPYYGTTASNSYHVIDLPAISNGQIFPDSPAPAAGFLEMHPGGGAAATMLEWTAGADEIGTLKLTFDLSRLGVGSGGLVPPQGHDDFTVYRNGSLLYSDYSMFIGTDTGLVTKILTGVTAGTKLDFVLSSTNGVLGFNLGYLNAQISQVSDVPEPGTWALMLGGVALLVTVQRIRRRSV